MDWIFEPWPWYVGGPLIGITVPLVLYIGNKSFGISSSFRHMCAACVPFNVSFFKYNWRAESWTLFLVLGVFLGAAIATILLSADTTVAISESTKSDLLGLGIRSFDGLNPRDIFSWSSLLSIKGFVFIVLGGFLVGFGTRYAGGCTSGHSITGLSNLQLPSLYATIAFFAGGLLMTHVIIPLILK